MAKQVTKRQQTVLDAVRTWIRKHGYSPSIRELGRLLGIKSLRGVTSHLDALARKGLLKRERRARSISLVDAVESIRHGLRIPILGRIRAGEPILAQEHVEGHVVVDASWVGKGASTGGVAHFALKVHGESMINAGILDGDFVIVRQQPTAHNGDIVVALLDDEATVKRFFKEGERVRLAPEHPTMKPLVVTKPQTVTVLGKVVGVFRKVG